MTTPMIDEEWIMEKWMIHYGQLWRCQWNTEWWLNLPVLLRNYVFDLRDSVSEAPLFFSRFLGSTGYKTILHDYMYMYHVYILYIFFHTRLVGKCTHFFCVTVLFLASRQCHVVGIQVVRAAVGRWMFLCLVLTAVLRGLPGRQVLGQNLRPGNIWERWTEPPTVLLFCSWVNVHMGASENWTCLPNRCKYSMSEEMSKISSENEDN